MKPKLDQSLGQPRFLARASAEKRDGQITPTPTQAVLAELIHLLPGARCLEIGTFFADTTRAISEAAALAGEGAHVTTIDPFGGHRVPAIMARWPEALQKVTTFLDQNSMSFFLDIELSRPASGREAPFSLIFIDGHHSYDYAFFDLLRGASYLRP
ncbi:MAG: class I SAM-dependent methyltransferase, partial [Bosea sp. (in: a-proteobacteria)]